MKQVLITEIINSKTLPKDELDDFWDNFFGFLPVIMLLMASTFSLFAKQSSKSVKVESDVIFFLISLSLFFYTVWVKKTERKLKSIQTKLDRKQNLALMEKLANENSWSIKTNKSYYKEYMLPFVFGSAGHKLTVLILNNEILYNLRNLGSGRGRMPYLFGIDTIKEQVLRIKIRKHA